MSRSSARRNRRQRAANLKNTIRKQAEYIQHLERVSEAYSRLEELAREELIEADQIIRAQEIIQEMLREEKISAVDTIQAHESVHRLMTEEKKQADQTIRAHERVEALAIKEKKEALETIRALHNLNLLADKEKDEAYRLIEAQDNVSQLSLKEMTERDKALRSIFKVNTRISAQLEEPQLLTEVLDSLTEAVAADHASIWQFEGEELKLGQTRGVALDDSEIKQAIQEVCQTGEPELKNRVTKKKDSAWIIVPLKNGNEVIGALAAVSLSEGSRFRPFDSDLIAIFAGQAAISLTNARLFERIKQQNTELLRLGNLKSQFIAHLSDELTPPVKALQKSWEKLDKVHEMSDDEHAKLLKSLKLKLDRVETTTSRILSLTSLEEEARELFFETVDFKSLTEEVLKRHQEHSTKLGLTITYEYEPEFSAYQANHSIIRTILDELLSNAIYYNYPQGEIRIKGEVKGEYLTLEVRDTGRGISQEEKELIFQQFYRNEESSELNEAGAGLGLFMARNFIERYRGSLEVESELGQGARFVARFLLH